MRNFLYIIIAVLVVGTAWAAWHFLGAGQLSGISQGAAGENALAANATSSPDEPRPVPEQCGQPEGAKCVEYRNDQYHFSVFRSELKDVKEYDEGGGAATITFENFDNVHGWQIFIVPYGEPQVSEARFKEDEPSGVRNDLQNITVDGATGAAFYSTSANLGETYEVWFIHDNYLYELTTLKALAPNMQERLATWKFI